MKVSNIFLAAVVLVTASCASSKKAKDVDNTKTIKKDYEVRDATSNIRPGWTIDAVEWAEQNKMDIVAYRYFSYETSPKIDREIACQQAEAEARGSIAAEISTFIDKSLGSSVEGKPTIDPSTDSGKAMKEFVERTLTEKVMALIHGAEVKFRYWEKRQYLEDLGAPRDYIGFTCAVFVKMEAAGLKKAIDRASELVQENAADPETKENVKKALEKADENFIKARKGQI